MEKEPNFIKWMDQEEAKDDNETRIYYIEEQRQKRSGEIC